MNEPFNNPDVIEYITGHLPSGLMLRTTKDPRYGRTGVYGRRDRIAERRSFTSDALRRENQSC